MPTVRRATPADWQDLRAVRLAALTDAPYAFGSTLATELRFDEARWREWPAKHAVFLGWLADRPAAIAAGIPGTEVEMISVWAHPDTRGTGLAAKVVTAVIDWAHTHNATQVTAWAVGTNTRALRFYQRLGFTLTGRDDDHPHNPALRELELVHPVLACQDF
ncbi:GNAT family N-acetyltransferase [Actinokineospora iranica]|uniref:Ribosomal protein S18 acetylase RimI n=1 Tax=Actinokineospora iranica TaxID=1271860 RepID=A0A1G6R862_9PSEU|nr:GNAT family N-acetyltransferase [Actinokineospora iranica]SDD00285.1 Ribosomal protein S18 acetylase RimI [Actinokineospora iranica]